MHVKQRNDEAPESPAGTGTPPRHRGQLIRILFALCLVMLLALSGSALLGYRYRVELINRALAQLHPPYVVSVSDLTFEGPHRIRIKGIEVRERDSERVILQADEAGWGFTIDQLRRRELGNLEVDNAILALTPKDLAQLRAAPAAHPERSSRSAEAPAGTGAAGTAGDIAWNSIRLGRLEFSYSGDASIPALAAVVELDGGPLAFSGRDGLEAGRHRLQFRELVIGDKATDPVRTDDASLLVEMEAASRKHLHIGRIEIDAGTITADLHRLLAARAGDKQPEGTPANMPGVAIDTVALRVGTLAIGNRRDPEGQATGRELEVSANGLLLEGSRGSIDTLDASLDDAGTGLLLGEGVRGSAERLALTASASWAAQAHIVISHADLVAPRLKIDLAAGAPSPQPTGRGTGPAGLALKLGDLRIANAHLELSGHDTVTALSSDFDLEADGWHWQDGQLSALPDSLQALEVHRLRASLAGIAKPIELSELLLQVIPAEFAETGVIRSLQLARFDLDLQGAELLAVPGERQANAREPLAPTPGDVPDPAPTRPIHADPSRWLFETLQVDGGRIVLPAVPELGIPRVEGTLSISTPEPEELPAGTHDISLRDLSLSTRSNPSAFYRSEEITARVDYREAWKGGGIRALRIGRGTLEVGEDLASLVPGSQEDGADLTAEAPATGEAPADTPLARLFPDLAQVAIADTRIILKDIAPGIRTVIFGLEKKPGKQRIELEHIEITSPYNPLLPVARLNTIFIEFTLAGLLEKTIDKVEIVNPTIYVGEHLFWFIEHYRTHGTPEEGEEETPAGKGWDIGEIHAYNGRLVVAPKGMPVPGLEVPFPFSCRTRLGQGLIEANLRIQNADYAIPDIEVLLENLEGTVEFNLPIKRVDNNLVQVLQAERLRFRQLEGTDPWVSFTYDQNGIYTRFGANAYGGYVQGEANIYIDEDYSWDAWAAMSEVETGPITEVLTPEYFRMQGRSNVTVVANGNIHELFRAKGQFTSPGGGNIDVRALNGLEDNIDVASPITRWLAEAGVDLLRQFRYDNADGNFDLYGREGALDFLLAGPDGKREFQVVVHDHRPIEEQQDPGS